MRFFLCFIIFVGLIGNVYSQDKKRIKEEFTKRFLYPDKKKNPRGKLYFYIGFTEKYDELGNTVYRETSDSSNVMISYDSLIYSNKNLVYIKQKIFDFSGKGDQYIGMQKMEYDSLGHRISRKVWANGVLESESLYKYDSNFCKTTILESNKGILIDSSIITSNEIERIYRTTSYSSFENGKPNKKEIQVIVNNERGIYSLWKNIQYKLKNEEWVKDDSTFTERKFDKKGNIISQITNYGEKKYKYKFDKYGNWTERIEIKNGTKEVLDRRKIVYY